MRIDLVITELDTGGAERCCVELALFLKHRGHRVRIYAIGPRPVPPKDALLIQLEKHSVDVVFLGGRTSWMLPVIAFKLWRRMRADRPDIVQSFLWHANVLCSLVVPRLRVPLVGGVRVADPSPARIRWSQWASRQMANVVCVSQSVAKWCQDVEGIAPNRIVVIPNGVVVAKAPLERPITNHLVPQNAKILLCVGRLHHQKGTDILVSRGDELMRRLPTHHLVFVGDGGMRPLVQQWIATSENKDRIHCLGQRDDVRAWMAHSELLLLPTRYEGMPNAILEAMAEGLPVATTRVEGISELLGDRLMEQSVVNEDWDGFMELVVSLARDQDLRKRLAQANRTQVEQHFDLDKQLVQYEQLYERLISKNGT